jgi:integrase
MSRPRKRNKGLPPYVRIRNGSYLYRDHKLCRVDEGEGRMYEELSKRKKAGDITMVPAAVAAYMKVYLPTLSSSAKREHARYLNIFAEEFADFRVDQVRPVDVKKSVRNLYSNKHTAAHHYKSRISTFFTWCVDEEGLRDTNPCAEVKLSRVASRKTPWTDELFWKVRDELAPMMQCYHDLSFLLYQRTTDVRLLKRTQIDGKVIHFAPTKTLKKTGAAVDIPITSQIQAALDRAADIRKEWKVVCPFVICTPQGTPYTPSGVYSAYKRADIALHGEDTRLHLNPKALRPYAATYAKKHGYTKEDLQVGLAHTTITTTEGYIQSHDVPVSIVALELPKREK